MAWQSVVNKTVKPFFVSHSEISIFQKLGKQFSVSKLVPKNRTLLIKQNQLGRNGYQIDGTVIV